MTGWKRLPFVMAVAVGSACSGEPGAEEASGEAESGPESTGEDGSTGEEGDTGEPQPDVPGSNCPEPQAIRALLTEAAGPYVDADGVPGKAIGLVAGVSTVCGQQVVGLGALERGGNEAPSADSIFELASLSKVYSGYLLGRGIESGEVLEDELMADTFPMGAPSFMAQPIDLLDLATHTSGLPNYPNNLPNPGPVNPTEGYTLAMMEEFLSTYDLPRAPGAEYEYSNLGSGILGHVLVTAAGEPSFHSLVLREIAEPFMLSDTAVNLDADQQARKVQGYAEGQPAPALSIPEFMHGGGAVHATATDVLTFFEAAVFTDDPAWERVKVPQRSLPFGENASIGYMLTVEETDDGRIYSKNGGAPGFSTQVVFREDPAVVVVILSNANSTQGLYQLGRTIIDEIEPLI